MCIRDSVMVYTFIGLSTQELLVCMLLAVACTVIMREVSLLCLRLVKRPFDTQLLLVGLFLWLYGLILLYRQLDSRPELLMSALAVALCTSGLAVSVTALAELERRMTDVAQFRLKDRMRGYAQPVSYTHLNRLMANPPQTSPSWRSPSRMSPPAMPRMLPRPLPCPPWNGATAIPSLCTITAL